MKMDKRQMTSTMMPCYRYQQIADVGGKEAPQTEPTFLGYPMCKKNTSGSISVLS